MKYLLLIICPVLLFAAMGESRQEQSQDDGDFSLQRNCASVLPKEAGFRDVTSVDIVALQKKIDCLLSFVQNRPQKESGTEGYERGRRIMTETDNLMSELKTIYQMKGDEAFYFQHATLCETDDVLQIALAEQLCAKENIFCLQLLFKQCGESQVLLEGAVMPKQICYPIYQQCLEIVQCPCPLFPESVLLKIIDLMRIRSMYSFCLTRNDAKAWESRLVKGGEAASREWDAQEKDFFGSQRESQDNGSGYFAKEREYLLLKWSLESALKMHEEEIKRLQKSICAIDVFFSSAQDKKDFLPCCEAGECEEQTEKKCSNLCYFCEGSKHTRTRALKDMFISNSLEKKKRKWEEENAKRQLVLCCSCRKGLRHLKIDAKPVLLYILKAMDYKIFRKFVNMLHFYSCDLH